MEKKFPVLTSERVVLRQIVDSDLENVFKGLSHPDIIKYYGKEVVKNILLNIRYLDKVTLSFCSTIFDVPKTEFRCYKLAQSNPEYWNY